MQTCPCSVRQRVLLLHLLNHCQWGPGSICIQGQVTRMFSTHGGLQLTFLFFKFFRIFHGFLCHCLWDGCTPRVGCRAVTLVLAAAQVPLVSLLTLEKDVLVLCC